MGWATQQKQSRPNEGVQPMRILALVQGEYGRRIVQNIQHHASDWTVRVWQVPDLSLEEAMDEPERFIPVGLDQADLILSLGESPAVGVLLPLLAQATGARAVIAPVDREEWLPVGLAGQLHQELAHLGVAAVFPKPFCSLSETTYNLRASRSNLQGFPQQSEDPLIAAFAERFGRPELRVQVGPDGKTIQAVELLRDSPCGSARYVAQRLVGVLVDEAYRQAGLFHHQFPCLASMCRIDPMYKDTLMHVAGDILREHVREQVEPFCTPPVYLRPAEHAETPSAPDVS